MSNCGFYQIWRQTRELDEGEPMNSAVREVAGWYETEEEAQAAAEHHNTKL